MLYVMKINTHVDGLKDRIYGQYVLEYDAVVNKDQTFNLLLVNNRQEAKKFGSVDEAHNYYMQVSPNIPRNARGGPNRPLTGWCVSLEPFDMH